MTVGTYLLYGCEVNIYPVPSKFADADEYIEYLYSVLNNNNSPYRIVYDVNSTKFFLGFIIDEAHDDDIDVSYLKSTSLTQIKSHVTVEVYESLEWLYLVYFDKVLEDTELDLHILITYY